MDEPRQAQDQSLRPPSTATTMAPVRCGKCGGTNVGTEEELIGTALVSGYDPQTGEFEYTGETVVYYDSSQTQYMDGQVVMFCRDCCHHFLLDGKTGREAPPGGQTSAENVAGGQGASAP